ncbi:uncharacterized protein LOC123554094 [Mercenaria mercenaria]|uniref:uncharacterized protein LOC123554094 n=1 Tax=Mercenaria mercenaria TaxID=6596 RepID=UPI00234F97A2|nr:uncharacterized protein LOC123554094 [Mercenaria mercenaria]
MNNKQREILHQHRNFLIKNVPWTDDVANKLLAQGIITDSFLKDIQNIKGGNNSRKILAKLLDVLPLKGSGVFEKFCNFLLLNGHPFIADFLRDEENANTDISDLKEIYKRIPALDKHLKDADKRVLEYFVHEKVKESILKGLWSKEAIAKEKDKAIDAKQRQLEDAFGYEDKEKRKNEEISELEKKLTQSRNEIKELKSQLGYVSSKLKETEDKFRSDFGVQIKYNNANENALRKLQEKKEQCEKVLQHIDTKIKEILHIPQRNSERDQMALMEFKFSFVEEDFKKLTEKYSLLLEIEKQYDKLLHERNYILAHLGHSKEQDKSLLNAYRDFAVKTDEDMMTMKEQLQKHSHIIEGQQETIQNLNKEVETNVNQRKMKQAGTVWQNAMMSVMRKQLNDVKHESRVKDTRIKHYEGEVAKLKAKIVELESSKAHIKSATHRHVHKDLMSPEQHRFTPGMHTDDDDSELDKYETKSRRNTLLPPLGGKVLYQASDVRVSPSQSPKRPKPKQNVYQKGMWSSPNAAMQEPLHTQQLKFENRSIGAQDKLGHMGHGLGGLKLMHGKLGKPSHVRT